MTSKLVQLQSKAAQASQLVAKHGGSYYRQLLERNKQYIQDPPTAEKCNLLSKQLLYTRLARLVFFVLLFDSIGHCLTTNSLSVSYRFRNANNDNNMDFFFFNFI
ncbi:ATP SYNTHASE SUBUNIT [Salix koriyanagi]|uniref:ATP SYNTHASE SUBUNIT n=1 Tax=Salix koriyanagi TaxID=2511006 RepID=A0A9Q0VC97_9ROSI|nr:ATP SYNTHASE SUBUNIT [Salix koriyanagi]